jgi:HlyD family secretion protein
MGIKRTCLCGLMVLAGCNKPATDIPAFGTLERDRIDLSADSNEPIRVILVREGQRVAAGESLLIQSNERAEVALARARAEEAVARSSLAEAESGPRAQEIVQGRARLEAARSARKTAKYELDRQVSLVERKFASASQVDTLRGRYEEALAREAEAEAALDELLAGTRSEAIDQARNHHAATSATVRDLELTVSRTIIHSPMDGIVETLPYEVGERPPVGATVVRVLAATPLYANVHIAEPVRTRVNSGTRALIRVDGYPDPFAGTVRWVSAEASFTPYFALNQHDRSLLSYAAEIDLTAEDNQGLPVGVPVQVTFPDLSP